MWKSLLNLIKKLSSVFPTYYLAITNYYKNIWINVIFAYVLLAFVTFIPTLRTILKHAKLNPEGDFFNKSSHFSEKEKVLLEQHYQPLTSHYN